MTNKKPAKKFGKILKNKKKLKQQSINLSLMKTIKEILIKVMKLINFKKAIKKYFKIFLVLEIFFLQNNKRSKNK